VTLEESGSAFTPGSVSIPLTLAGTGTLLNGTASTSGGVATYSKLEVSAAGTGDVLTANLTLTSGAAKQATISANSHPFDVAAGTVATPTITWTTPAAITYGTPLSATQLNATANVPGTFSYVPMAGTVLNAGTQSLSVTFYPSDSAHYAVTTATVNLIVNKAITNTALAGFPVGGNIVSFIVDVTSQGGTFGGNFGVGVTVTTSTGESCTTHTINGFAYCAINFANAASRTATATFAGDNNYAPSVSAPITVTPSLGG
jgi:hypothetical protein